MKKEDTNLKLSVIVSETATPKQRKLADWLTTALAELDVEAHLEQEAPDEDNAPKEYREQSVPDEGKPKTPLPEKEEFSSNKDGSFLPDDESWEDSDPWPPEPDEDRESIKERTRGFLTGLFTAWLVTGAGVLTLRLARSCLHWLAELTDIPFDVLVGLCFLAALALFLRRKTRQFALKIASWFDFDF